MGAKKKIWFMRMTVLLTNFPFPKKKTILPLREFIIRKYFDERPKSELSLKRQI